MKYYHILLLLLLTSFLSGAQTVAFYHFDGTNGTPASTISDASGSGLDGTIVGAANYTQGVLHGGLDLSGDGNYVAIPQASQLVLSNSWTVEMFFRANTPYSVFGSDPSVLINKLNTPAAGIYLDSFELQLSSSGTIYAQIGFGNLTGQELDTASHKNYSDGQWHHVALVYKTDDTTGTNTISIYADYELVAASTGVFPPIAWAGYPINIGAGNYPNNDPSSQFRRNLDGQVDEVRISEGALTPNQFVSIPSGRVAPLSIQLVDAGAQLSWGSNSNETYQLQSRDAFGTGAWTNLGGPWPGTGSGQSLQDPFVPGRSQSFYQLLVWP